MSRTDRGDSGTHYNAWCQLGCGLIGAAPRATCVEAVTAHFLTKHPDETLIVQGQQFTMEVAPLRCDVCNVIAEPPYWTRKVAIGNIMGDDDGLWLVCDPCEQLLLVEGYEGIWQRWVGNLLYESPQHKDQPKSFWIDSRDYQLTSLTLLRQGEVSGPEGINQSD